MTKIAMVSGANQGLGFALVETLSRQLGSDGIVYLTARNAERGQQAVKQLASKGVETRFLQLDVTDQSSLDACSEYIRREHGGLDIVVSNAAARMAKEQPQAQQVKDFIDTNNHGTYRMIKTMGPLLRDGARFLVVASGFGSLRNLDPSLHHLFDISQRSIEDIETTMDEYARLVQEKQDEQLRWPNWMNIPSKIAQVASVKIFAKQMKEQFSARKILINAVCPGLVDTDASRPWFNDMSSAKSPLDAAVDLVWVATLPESVREPYGELVQHRKVIAWK